MDLSVVKSNEVVITEQYPCNTKDDNDNDDNENYLKTRREGGNKGYRLEEMEEAAFVEDSVLFRGETKGFSDEEKEPSEEEDIPVEEE
jgi:hypothetical protein